MKYKLTLCDEESTVIADFEINTEIDHVSKNIVPLSLDSLKESDFYVLSWEVVKLGFEKVGRKIGERIVREITINEKWE